MLQLHSAVGRSVGVLLAAGTMLCGSMALAQYNAKAALADSEPVAVNPHRSNLSKMFRPITTEFNDTKLEQVIAFLEDYTGATLEVHWADSTGGEGLNREQAITMKVKNLSVMTLLERVLAKAGGDVTSSGNTWQMTEYGTIEIGPKSVLNRTKRTELYDIHDLLIEIPRYDEVPQIDLQSLLQQSQQGGGGGGQSPFRNDQDRQDRRENQKSNEDKGKELITLITSLVETEEWVDNGGEGGTIRYYNGNILVNAPDYMQRQINGYTYWPSYTARNVGGRRYVSLNSDNQIGKVDGFAEVPVSAVVGGQVVSSQPGGSTAPATPGKKPNGNKKPAKTDPKKDPAAPKDEKK